MKKRKKNKEHSEEKKRLKNGVIGMGRIRGKEKNKNNQNNDHSLCNAKGKKKTVEKKI